MSSSGTDRWEALDFAPPPPDVVETEAPVLLDYLADGRVAWSPSTGPMPTTRSPPRWAHC